MANEYGENQELAALEAEWVYEEQRELEEHNLDRMEHYMTDWRKLQHLRQKGNLISEHFKRDTDYT